MSFSNPGYSAALQAAIDYAWAHDVVLVAATGNDGSSAPPSRPATAASSASPRPTRTTCAGRPNYGAAAFLGAPGLDSSRPPRAAASLDHGHVGLGGHGRGSGSPAARERPVRLERGHRRPPCTQRRSGGHDRPDRQRASEPSPAALARTRSPARPKPDWRRADRRRRTGSVSDHRRRRTPTCRTPPCGGSSGSPNPASASFGHSAPSPSTSRMAIVPVRGHLPGLAEALQLESRSVPCRPVLAARGAPRQRP